MDRYDTLMAVAASPWDGAARTLAVLALVTAVAAVAAREAARHARGSAVRTRQRLVALLGVAAVALGGATWAWQDLVHRSRVADARAVVREILAERGMADAATIDVLAGDGGVTAIARLGGGGTDDTLWVNALRPSADPTAVYPAGVDPSRPLVVSMP